MPGRRYVPDRGDFVWIDLNPRKGHEQAGQRPALVLSPQSYNRKTGLCVVCPATRQAKGYAFEVKIVAGTAVEGVILADHVRSVDWRVRNLRRIRRVSDGILAEVVAKIAALIIDPQ
jgi:mRNA interferase MazF